MHHGNDAFRVSKASYDSVVQPLSSLFKNKRFPVDGGKSQSDSTPGRPEYCPDRDQIMDSNSHSDKYPQPCPFGL